MVPGSSSFALSDKILVESPLVESSSDLAMASVEEFAATSSASSLDSESPSSTAATEASLFWEEPFVSPYAAVEGASEITSIIESRQFPNARSFGFTFAKFFFKTSPFLFISKAHLANTTKWASKPGDCETNCPVIHLQSGDFVEANLEGYRPRLGTNVHEIRVLSRGEHVFAHSANS